MVSKNSFPRDLAEDEGMATDKSPAPDKKAAREPMFVRIGSGDVDAPQIVERKGSVTIVVVGSGAINLFLGDDFGVGDVVEIYPDASGAHTLALTVPEGGLIFGIGAHPIVMRLGYRLTKVSETEWGAIGS